MKKSLLLILSLFLLNVFSIFSQGAAVYNLSGKIKDKKNKNPVSSSQITFKSDKGETNRSKTDADGNYQVVLQANTNYTLEIPNFLTTFDDVSFFLPSIQKYQELEKNFEITKMEEGMMLINTNAFEPQVSSINIDKAIFLTDLKDLMKTHPTTIWEIRVSSVDSYFADISKKEKYTDGKKVKTRKVVTKASEQAQKLLDERVESMKNYCEKIGLKMNNLVFTQDLKIGKKAKKTSKKAIENEIFNVTVSINKIKILK